MRSWRLLGWVVIAGCYRPAPEGNCAISCASGECPSGLVCDDNLCHVAGTSCSGGADAGVDAGEAGIRCEPGTFSNDFQLVTGSGYVVDQAHDDAVYYDDIATKILEIPPDVSVAGTEILHTERGTFQLTNPRLAPGGDQLFFSSVSDIDGVTYLMRSDKDMASGTWQPPVIVSDSLLAGFVAGTVSSTSPRHMVIQQVGFFEGTEDASSMNWTFALSSFSFSFMTLRDPSLSADGLHLVFAGQPLAGADAIYMAERDSIEQPFGTPKILITRGGGRTPFLSSDCKDLYFSTGTNVRWAH